VNLGILAPPEYWGDTWRQLTSRQARVTGRLDAERQNTQALIRGNPDRLARAAALDGLARAADRAARRLHGPAGNMLETEAAIYRAAAQSERAVTTGEPVVTDDELESLFGSYYWAKLRYELDARERSATYRTLAGIAFDEFGDEAGQWIADVLRFLARSETFPAGTGYRRPRRLKRPRSPIRTLAGSAIMVAVLLVTCGGIWYAACVYGVILADRYLAAVINRRRPLIVLWSLGARPGSTAIMEAIQLLPAAALALMDVFVWGAVPLPESLGLFSAMIVSDLVMKILVDTPRPGRAVI
jgi:hypothetical protein